MTVGADGAHTSGVGVVNGLLIFRNDEVCHFMAHVATEVERIGLLHSRIESPPENNPGESTYYQDSSPGIFTGGAPKPFPQFHNHLTTRNSKLETLNSQL